MASKIRELPVREKREYGSSNEHDRVNNLSMDMNNERESRALLMLELYAKGYSQTEIASKLQISQPTVSKEMRYQIQCIYEHKQEWIQEMYEDDVRAKVGRRMMQRELWSMIEARADPKEKLVAFSYSTEFIARRWRKQ